MIVGRDIQIVHRGVLNRTWTQLRRLLLLGGGRLLDLILLRGKLVLVLIDQIWLNRHTLVVHWNQGIRQQLVSSIGHTLVHWVYHIKVNLTFLRGCRDTDLLLIEGLRELLSL